MKTENKRGGRRRLYYLLIALLVLVGAGGLFYPFISSRWNDLRNRQLVSGYSRAVKKAGPDQRRKIWKEAKAYNAQHLVNNLVDAFHAGSKAYKKTHPYDDLLNPDGNGVMGSIEIPKIHITLPIFHGTGPKALQRGCGHLAGSSLPVGGKGSHAVLSAHRGLPSARLFTDLDQLKKGDCFYLHIMDKVLAYQVNQILTVLPEQSESLAIDPDQDYVTLVICTPYGVNTHRLLVRGHRVPYKAADAGQGTDASSNYTGVTEKILLAGLAILLLIIAILLVIDRILRKRRSRRED